MDKNFMTKEDVLVKTYNNTVRILEAIENKEIDSGMHYGTKCIICDGMVPICEAEARHYVAKICGSCRDAILKLKAKLKEEENN